MLQLNPYKLAKDWYITHTTHNTQFIPVVTTYQEFKDILLKDITSGVFNQLVDKSLSYAKYMAAARGQEFFDKELVGEQLESYEWVKHNYPELFI